MLNLTQLPSCLYYYLCAVMGLLTLSTAAYGMFMSCAKNNTSRYRNGIPVNALKIAPACNIRYLLSNHLVIAYKNNNTCEFQNLPSLMEYWLWYQQLLTRQILDKSTWRNKPIAINSLRHIWYNFSRKYHSIGRIKEILCNSTSQLNIILVVTRTKWPSNYLRIVS